ncbi:neural proliferation differentiation and control protein 1 [Thalassophryne amazonica]|uniref:neural proliferation differentiation and control protein 1 n=1 Tax=Thalassophryne amazonica TaxID=390379 RepID=UPI001470E44C|nr:neural proliferation differentiation and control protein 1 [Thalassophryne amazonica]
MRVPLLGRAAVFAALLSVSSCLTGSHLCPRALDCARAGRHFCQPGSSHCGPCLRLLVENSHGRCVVRRRHTPHSGHSTKGKTSASPELDEQIDFLSAIISEQRQTETRLPAPPSQDVTNHASKGALIPTHSLDTAEQPTNRSTLFITTAPPTTTNHTPTLLSGPIILPYPSNDNVFIIMSSVFIVAASLALIIAAACWIRLQKSVCVTQKLGYPVYGLMREQTFDTLPGDKKLAHSAQMYHYQHQKQQMLCLEKQRNESKVTESGATTDEENEDGDFTVYECPGLAPTGEMEVKNPLFDDSTLYLQRVHK